jgi:hypothetical protein
MPLCANNVVQRHLWPVLDKLKIPRCGLKAFRHPNNVAIAPECRHPRDRLVALPKHNPPAGAYREGHYGEDAYGP